MMGVSQGHTSGLARAMMLLLLPTAAAWNLSPAMGTRRTAAHLMQVEDPAKVREQLLTTLPGSVVSLITTNTYTPTQAPTHARTHTLKARRARSARKESLRERRGPSPTLSSPLSQSAAAPHACRCCPRAEACRR